MSADFYCEGGIKNVRLIAVAIVGLSIPLWLQGISNYYLGGRFRVLPWQGAYNLNAANNERSNGKFYKQFVVIESKEDWEYSARIESEYLFRKNRQVSGDQDFSIGYVIALFQKNRSPYIAWAIGVWQLNQPFSTD